MRSRVVGLVLFASAAAPVAADDLLIRGGLVVNADGSRVADVRVRAERIVEVGKLDPGGPGERVIAAEGLLVLPGGVDPHVHLAGWGETPTLADDFESGTRAALAGGITTVGHMAFPLAGELPLAALERARAEIEAQALSDVFVHSTIFEPTPPAIAQLPQLVAAGQPSIKVFMSFDFFEAQLDGYLRLLAAAAEAGVVVAVHCEDAATIEFAIRELTARGRTSLAAYADSRPEIAEVVATQRALAMAEATGATIYVVHLSAARALAAVAAARDRVDVHVETRPLYLHLTDAAYEGPEGGLFVGQPPIRGAADRDALWRGLASGAIDTVATDHAPWTREQKLDPDQTVVDFRAGVNNLQLMLPMLFSEGVVGERLSRERFVAVTSTNAARIFGLYPRKGVIAAGSDADLVLWSPTRTRVVRDEDVLSRAGFSIYSGTEVTGWPEMTIAGGRVVFADGKVSAEAGSGRLIRREVAAALP